MTSAKKQKAKIRTVDKNGRPIEVGDRIRVTGAPTGLRDQEDMVTKTIFERCVGRVFYVRRFQDHLAELTVGRVMGETSSSEKIWVEPEFIELVWSKKAKINRSKRPRRRGRVLK